MPKHVAHNHRNITSKVAKDQKIVTSKGNINAQNMRKVHISSQKMGNGAG